MKLIPKDAVLAVIDKFKHEGNIPYDRGLFELVCDIESDINSLEVKEVDLEKEYKEFIKCTDGRSMFEIAKHFFELGLSTSNPITASDRGMAEEIIVNLKRVEQDYRINLTREMEWLRNKVKKRG